MRGFVTQDSIYLEILSSPALGLQNHLIKEVASQLGPKWCLDMSILQCTFHAQNEFEFKFSGSLVWGNLALALGNFDLESNIISSNFKFVNKSRSRSNVADPKSGEI